MQVVLVVRTGSDDQQPALMHLGWKAQRRHISGGSARAAKPTQQPSAAATPTPSRHRIEKSPQHIFTVHTTSI